MSQNQQPQWTEEAVDAVYSPFNDHLKDQFVMTLGARGYMPKTAEEAENCLQTALALHEKIASGQIQAPSRHPSQLEMLNEKVASAIGGSPQDQHMQALYQNIQEKVAASVYDPFTLYASIAADSLENQQQQAQ
jgi:hypothetical protein